MAATLGDGPYPKAGGWTESSSDIRAAISVAGPYELNTLSWGNLWTPVAGNAEEERRIASPITHVSATTKPLLVIHSDDDKSVPIRQAVDMVAKLNGAFDVTFDRQIFASVQLAFDYDRFTYIHDVLLHAVTPLRTNTGGPGRHRRGRGRNIRLSARWSDRFISLPHVVLRL